MGESEDWINLALNTKYGDADPVERAKAYALTAIAMLLHDIAKKMPTPGDIGDLAASVDLVAASIGSK